MNKLSLFVFIALLFVGACEPATPQAILASVTPSYTTSPSPTATVRTTFTVTPLPVTPFITPTETSRPNIAPTLPHADVRFVSHGDRDRHYVALTFDLCQKPELPSWFDQSIVDTLVKYDVPATFFMGGDWMRTHPEETKLLASNPASSWATIPGVIPICPV